MLDRNTQYCKIRDKNKKGHPPWMNIEVNATSINIPGNYFLQFGKVILKFMCKNKSVRAII